MLHRPLPADDETVGGGRCGRERHGLGAVDPVACSGHLQPPGPGPVPHWQRGRSAGRQLGRKHALRHLRGDPDRRPHSGLHRERHGQSRHHPADDRRPKSPAPDRDVA